MVATDHEFHFLIHPSDFFLNSFVEDVDIDPVIIINGLTKNWRCPGFRVCWIVAPKPIVDMLGSAGTKSRWRLYCLL